MVTIIGCEMRTNKENEAFVVLVLQSDLAIVQSQETGKFYATAKKCTMPTTLKLEQAQGLIGRDIPGRIVKVECEPYNFTVEETGEVLTLSHHWEYMAEDAPVPLRVVSNKEAA